MGSSAPSTTAQPRWDRINSAAVLAQARHVYYQFLERYGGPQEPLGIVITQPQSGHGRVVFELPVLLPNEQFIPIDLLRARSGRGRTSRSPYRG